MADKRGRELVKMAEAEGWYRPRYEPGRPHGRIVGLVGGQLVEVVVSATKAFATRHNQACTRRNLRRVAELALQDRARI